MATENSDDIRLIVKIAQLYYEQDMTQAQIARELGIYRTTISRLLKRGREQGIVTIAINYDYNENLWLEQQLTAAPYALGADMSLLDCYIAAMCSWGPRRAWFMAHTPKFVAVADKVYQRPELQQVLRDNELI